MAWAGGLVTALAVTAGAQGGLLLTEGAAYDDGATVWRGTVRFQNAPFFAALVVDVDYCVYTRSEFDSVAAFSGANLPAYDPDDGPQYVYTYQLFNNLTHDAGVTPDYVQQFSTGLDGDENASNVGRIAGTGQLPSVSNLPGTSAVWYYFGGNRLYYPATSAVLHYTSPYPPEWDNGTVQGVNAVTHDDAMPSPTNTPEPATMVLLILGGGLCLGRTQRSHR
jgi:hypothetical protein